MNDGELRPARFAVAQPIVNALAGERSRGMSIDPGGLVDHEEILVLKKEQWQNFWRLAARRHGFALCLIIRIWSIPEQLSSSTGLAESWSSARILARGKLRLDGAGAMGGIGLRGCLGIGFEVLMN